MRWIKQTSIRRSVRTNWLVSTSMTVFLRIPVEEGQIGCSSFAMVKRASPWPLFKLSQMIRESAWVSTNELVYADKKGFIYPVQKVGDNWEAPKKLKSFQPPDQAGKDGNNDDLAKDNDPRSGPLARLTGYEQNSLLWQDKTSLWSFKLNATAPEKLWQAKQGAELIDFSYSQESGRLLLFWRECRRRFAIHPETRPGWKRSC